MKTRINKKISYSYKNRLLEVEFSYPKDNQYLKQVSEECAIEDIEQEIRESILNECLGWELAMKKEHKEIEKMHKNLKIEFA